MSSVAATTHAQHARFEHLADHLAQDWGSTLATHLTSTVPRELVHRSAVAEVFLTGWRRETESRFTLTAQWPRAHSFFTSVNGCYDPLLATETIRQVGSLLAHAEFGVPFGHQFLMWDLQCTLHPEHAMVGAAPADLRLDVICSQIRRRGTRLLGMHYQVSIHRGDDLVASGSATFDCTTPDVYQRLRGSRALAQPLSLTQPVEAATVGRIVPGDVVLSPTDRPLRWQLRADTRHPVLFDHPVDHIPGMVLIEAARQATTSARTADAFRPTRMQAAFHRYAELDRPCWIEAEHLPQPRPGVDLFQVVGRQDGEPVFDCLLGFSAQGR
jgi:hypothetical protein